MKIAGLDMISSNTVDVDWLNGLASFVGVLRCVNDFGS